MAGPNAIWVDAWLPLYWCPCVPVTGHQQHHWVSPAEILESLPRPLLNYFVYALQQVSPEELDPMKALEADLRPWRRLPGIMDRNMWCTASFLHAAGLSSAETRKGYVPAARPDPQAPEVFSFIPAVVQIDSEGRTRSITEDPSGKIHVFTAADHGRYRRR
jgi:hypothetical protein